MRTFTAIILAALVLTGCFTNRSVVVSTGTSIGVDIDENPTTAMYHGKLGYNRGELAVVPTTNGYTPDVLVELHYSGIFSRGADSGIYQRLAVGPTAVSQPGAMAMFLKDPSGNISTNAAAAIKSLGSIPTVNPQVQAALSKVASVYKVSPDKQPWDNVAKAQGYPTFTDLLIDPSLTPSKLADTVTALRLAKLLN